MANGRLRAGLAFLFAVAASQAHAAADWDGCIGAPTRACVLDLAEADLAGQTGFFLQSQSLIRLATARANAGLIGEAEKDFAKVAQMLKDRAADPTVVEHGERAIVLGQLAEALAAAGHIDQAIATADELETDGGSAMNAFAAIAAAQAKAGKMEEAKAMIARAEKGADSGKRGNLSFYSDIYAAQRTAGLAEDAARTLQLERNAAQAAPEPGMQFAAMMQIAVEQAKAGDLAGALETLQPIKDPRQHEVGIFRVLVPVIAAGKFDQAMPIIDALGDRARFPALQRLAEAQAKAGHKAAAEAALTKAKAIVAALPDGPERAIDLAYFAASEMIAGDESAATADMTNAGKLFDAVSASDKTAWTGAYGSALAKSGRVKEALALVAAMPADGRRDQAYFALADGASQAGGFEGALTAFRRTAPGDFRGSMLEGLASGMTK